MGFSLDSAPKRIFGEFVQREAKGFLRNRKYFYFFLTDKGSDRVKRDLGLKETNVMPRTFNKPTTDALIQRDEEGKNALFWD